CTSSGEPPRRITLPPSGCARPRHSEIAVDLPAPLGPSSASSSPRRTLRSRPSSATSLPYRFETPCSCANADSSAGSRSAGVTFCTRASIRFTSDEVAPFRQAPHSECKQRGRDEQLRADDLKDDRAPQRMRIVGVLADGGNALEYEEVEAERGVEEDDAGDGQPFRLAYHGDGDHQREQIGREGPQHGTEGDEPGWARKDHHQPGDGYRDQGPWDQERDRGGRDLRERVLTSGNRQTQAEKVGLFLTLGDDQEHADEDGGRGTCADQEDHR